ncbi:hypothetical protein BJV78DRAFT_1153810 [Lactifluus subvellereus]|nr:hypothetical protein BJV78DRAFT_1153810 [Lactifluus subvellereus]
MRLRYDSGDVQARVTEAISGQKSITRRLHGQCTSSEYGYFLRGLLLQSICTRSAWLNICTIITQMDSTKRSLDGQSTQPTNAQLDSRLRTSRHFILMLCLVSVVEVCIEQQGIQCLRAVQFNKTWAWSGSHCDNPSESNEGKKRRMCQLRLVGDAFSSPDNEVRKHPFACEARPRIDFLSRYVGRRTDTEPKEIHIPPALEINDGCHIGWSQPGDKRPLVTFLEIHNQDNVTANTAATARATFAMSTTNLAVTGVIEAANAMRCFKCGLSTPSPERNVFQSEYQGRCLDLSNPTTCISKNQEGWTKVGRCYRYGCLSFQAERLPRRPDGIDFVRLGPGASSCIMIMMKNDLWRGSLNRYHHHGTDSHGISQGKD